MVIEILDAALAGIDPPEALDKLDLHLSVCTASLPLAATAQLAAAPLLPAAAALYAFTSIPTLKEARRVFVESEGIALPPHVLDALDLAHLEGHTMVMVGVDDRLGGAISLRGASSIATDTAHVVFLDGGLSKLCDLRDIARDLDRNVNRSWSMIVAPNVTNVVGVFTMGFGIMTSVITNNVSALFALGNGLLPLRKIAQAEADRRRDRATAPAEPIRRDLVPMPPLAATRRRGDPSADQHHVFTESA